MEIKLLQKITIGKGYFYPNISQHTPIFLFLKKMNKNRWYTIAPLKGSYIEGGYVFLDKITIFIDSEKKELHYCLEKKNLSNKIKLESLEGIILGRGEK